MATVNERVKKIFSSVINGVDLGGSMSAKIDYGYDEIVQSAPDGLAVPVTDRAGQFVKFTITSQDWVEFINLLTGTLGTYVFYQRKSGTAAATGYIKHTLTNPVINAVRIEQRKGDDITITASGECRAASETATIATMWSQLDDQAAPAYITSARGGWRVVSAALGAVSFYHILSFRFGITAQLVRACNDADVAYTCVDVEAENMDCSGSIDFEDSTIATASLLCQRLALAAEGSLVITVQQSRGDANKVITIANALFTGGSDSADVSAPFGSYTAGFVVNNNPAVPLTLDGANKIITIADEV